MNITFASQRKFLSNRPRREAKEYQRTTKAISGTFEIMKGYASRFIMFCIILMVGFGIVFFLYFKSFKKEMVGTINDTYALYEKVHYITTEQYKILKDMQADQKNKKEEAIKGTG